jgi:LysM repeat protein
MKRLQPQTTAVIVLILAGLVLAACTRSAGGGPVPTATTGAGIIDGTGETDPTMAALGTTVASQLTQTAIAMGQGGGDGLAETPTTAPPVETATPIPQATAMPVPPAAAGCPSPYTVRQGDWIYKIARACQVEPSAIIALNPGINPNFIVPGQQLNMPAAGATAVPPATPQACTGSHTVVRGENLFRIAFNCGFTTEELALFNGIAFPYIIYPGNVIRFP